MLSKLKIRWGINSNLQILKIFIVFGITGSTAAWVSEPICNFFGINTDNLNILIYWFARIILISIVYQFILIFVAFLFGVVGVCGCALVCLFASSLSVTIGSFAFVLLDGGSGTVWS